MLSFIGVGISDGDVSLKALRAIKESDEVFYETYTSVCVSKEYLEKISGKDITEVGRSFLEEKSSEVAAKAKTKNIAVLVPGDPMAFTTHHSVYIEAKEKKVPVRIIHGISIYSAAVSSSGLQSSRFGRSVTLPVAMGTEEEKHIISDIEDNIKRGLHTLVLSDPSKKPKDAIDFLSRFGKIICMSSVGSEEQKIVYGPDSPKGFVQPFCAIVPGRLHFMEKGFLNNL